MREVVAHAQISLNIPVRQNYEGRSHSLVPDARAIYEEFLANLSGF